MGASPVYLFLVGASHVCKSFILNISLSAAGRTNGRTGLVCVCVRRGAKRNNMHCLHQRIDELETGEFNNANASRSRLIFLFRGSRPETFCRLRSGKQINMRNTKSPRRSRFIETFTAPSLFYEKAKFAPVRRTEERLRWGCLVISFLVAVQERAFFRLRAASGKNDSNATGIPSFDPDFASSNFLQDTKSCSPFTRITRYNILVLVGIFRS